MVVVDKLSNATHFIPIKSTFQLINVAFIYLFFVMKEVFKLHGVPKTIILDIDSNITSNLWKTLFEGL